MTHSIRLKRPSTKVQIHLRTWPVCTISIEWSAHNILLCYQINGDYESIVLSMSVREFDLNGTKYYYFYYLFVRNNILHPEL